MVSKLLHHLHELICSLHRLIKLILCDLSGIEHLLNHLLWITGKGFLELVELGNKITSPFISELIE
jgi:hypothetical protein